MTEELKSPFIERSVKCPACKQLSAQRTFRSRMFTPQTTESDQHVVSFKWLKQDVKRAHPPHYFLHYCPKCFYTDISDEFSNPDISPTYRRRIRPFKNANEKQRQIIELLGKHVHYDEIDFTSAMNLHFLAVFAQMLSPEENQDSYKISRLMLRIAWLYRENRPDADDGLHIPSVAEILEGMKILDKAADKARKSWEKVSKAVDRRAGELEKQLRINPDKNPYTQHSADLAKQFDTLFLQLYRLKTTCKLDMTGKLLDENSNKADAGSFFSFPSYEAFFEKLKSVWPIAPTDEIEAMRGAVAHFQHAASTDPRFDDPDRQFSVISLIADLLIRCNDIDAALTTVGSIHKSALNNRQRCMKELQQKNIDPVTKRRVKAQMERASGSLERASDLRHELLDTLFKRDMPKINKILARCQGAPLEQIEKALRDNGIVEPLILRLQEKGGPLENSRTKKKRGFF